MVDEGVVGDARAKNATNGPWSFRWHFEHTVPPGVNPGNALKTWFEEWKTSQKVNYFEVAARPDVQQKALCNWLRNAPSNQCDAGCTACVAQNLDMAVVPFRLIAITNRADLVTVNDDPSTAGEVRFIYALTQGPGDDPSSPGMDMTVIFEYRQPLLGRTRKQTAQAWHALGRHDAFDEAYKADLDAVLQSFVKPGLEPDRPLGNSLAQLRSNEREFDFWWDLREHLVTPTGLEITHVANTPADVLNGSEDLATFLRNNRADVLAHKHVVPARLSGGASRALQPWHAPNIETEVVRAFSEETCNGCHQNNMLDLNFHVSPHKKGIDKLSRFVHDPSNLAAGEGGKREAFMRTQLCAAE